MVFSDVIFCIVYARMHVCSVWFFLEFLGKFPLKAVTSSFSQNANSSQLAGWYFYFIKVSIGQWKLLVLWILRFLVLYFSHYFSYFWMLPNAPVLHKQFSKSPLLPPQKCSWRSEWNCLLGLLFTSGCLFITLRSYNGTSVEELPQRLEVC